MEKKNNNGTLMVLLPNGKAKELMPLDIVPTIGAKRTTYKQKVWNWYYNDEITADERDSLIKKHEEKLKQKRKYQQGYSIKSIDELLKQKYVYLYGKIYHIGWVLGWQLGWCKKFIDKGMIFSAIKKEIK